MLNHYIDCVYQKITLSKTHSIPGKKTHTLTQLLFWHKYTNEIITWVLLAIQLLLKSCFSHSAFWIQHRPKQADVTEHMVTVYPISLGCRWRCIYTDLRPKRIQHIFCGRFGVIYLHWVCKISHLTARCVRVLEYIKLLCQFGRNSFKYRAAVLWNTLPRDIREAQNIDEFKYRYRKHYLTKRD